MSSSDDKPPTSAAVPSAKRLALLEQMVQSGTADSFAQYALAMEYRKLGRVEDSLNIFEGLRNSDPDYVPQYLMVGQMLSEQGRKAEARSWLEAGLPKARAAGDSKAVSEIEDALAQLD